ncbi:lipoprotein [Ralstonia solanacearum]|uniref:LPS-assembly lipoprotein LptE n=2 Tax=Ralstonia solanacearum TaxID=305 RepID=A0A0S4TT59_RALSL|nr:lipoprotein [Ralstonia solanacearum]CUV13013.1 putative lipoprotein rlpB lipoprotein family [Ralstonia solanacearum]
MVMPSRRRFVFALAAALPAAGLLSACGFHLRGNNDFAFKRLYINLPQNSQMRAQLRRLIDNGSDTVVVSDKQDADALLDVLSENRVKTISSLTPQGVVREYRITYRFSFQLRDAHDNLLIPPSEITLFRDLSYNETQVLAKDYEEAALYRDMQGDVVNQLVRRLASVRLPS